MPATASYGLQRTRADRTQGVVPVSHIASADSSGHPMARLARLAASAGGSEASQRAAVIRCPLKPAESSETSQRMGGPMMRSVHKRMTIRHMECLLIEEEQSAMLRRGNGGN